MKKIMKKLKWIDRFGRVDKYEIIIDMMALSLCTLVVYGFWVVV